jgi:Zn-dependent protease
MTDACDQEGQSLIQRILDILSGKGNPAELAGLIIALVLGITVHEFSHALVATWLGDDLPRRQGRLSLSPAAHLDVVGSLMFIVGGFGWGKPVQYNPYALRASPRTGPALVALGGPVSNFIFAAVVAIPVRLFPLILQLDSRRIASFDVMGFLFETLEYTILYLLMLGVFNLIPIFPLDGFTVLQGLLPAELAERLEMTRQYGMVILLLLVFAGGSILGQILQAPIGLLYRLLVVAGT